MEPIEGARVRVYFHETYEENYTDSSGYYHVTNIPICYCLKNATASKDGYTTEWVLLAIGENTTHDFVLTLLGKTLYVGGTGPGNYSKIQDAINDASDGDTVFVYNDSSPYYEYKIVISKSINLIGEDKNTTIIDGGGIGDSVLKFYADWINISGFAIQNSTGSFLEDAGIEIHSNYSTISGNIIINNINGIIIHSSNNNTFSDNTITNNEFCGIYLQNSSDNTITGNTFISNIRVGLYLSNSNRNTITNNSFFN